jgi:DNA-binding transcriptional ArsR family regulator
MSDKSSRQGRRKAQIQMVLSLLALVAMLGYTFWHTGTLLSRYINPWWLGFVAAAGVELTVVAMSIHFDLLSDRDKSLLSKALFLFVFTSTLAVSAMANVSEGFYTAKGLTLTMSTFGQIDPVQAVIGISATGLLSICVMSLAEMLGDSFSVMLGIVSDVGKLARQHGCVAASLDGFDVGRGIAHDTARVSKQQAIAAMLSLLADRPNINKTELAAAIGKSRATVGNYLAELTAAGVISGNGDGYIIVVAER